MSNNNLVPKNSDVPKKWGEKWTQLYKTQDLIELFLKKIIPKEEKLSDYSDIDMITFGEVRGWNKCRGRILYNASKYFDKIV